MYNMLMRVEQKFEFSEAENFSAAVLQNAPSGEGQNYRLTGNTTPAMSCYFKYRAFHIAQTMLRVVKFLPPYKSSYN